jgi:hypothetical protein
MTSTTSVRPLAALQQTLAAEHAAVNVYGVLGGLAAGLADASVAARLQAAYDAHRARRDQLRSTITDLGKAPVAAEAAYRVDVHGGAAHQLLAVARVTEERCAGFYAQLVASSVAAQRRWAITALTDAAVRVLALEGSPDAYPGADELATS